MTDCSHTQVRLLSQNKRNAVKKLWIECFGDSADFIDFMLDGALSDAEIFMLEQDGILCSMFFLLSIQLKCADGTHDAHYLYAASTSGNMRGKGYFSALLAFSYEYMKENGSRYLICRPGNDGLFRFYEKYGFHVCTFLDQKQIKPTNKGYNFIKSRIKDDLYRYYLCECEKTNSTVIKSKKAFLESVKCAMFDRDTELFEFENGFVLLKNGKDIVYICSDKNKNDIAGSMFFGIGTEGSFSEYNDSGRGLPYAMIKSFDEKNDIHCVCSLLFD